MGETFEQLDELLVAPGRERGDGRESSISRSAARPSPSFRGLTTDAFRAQLPAVSHSALMPDAIEVATGAAKATVFAETRP